MPKILNLYQINQIPVAGPARLLSVEGQVSLTVSRMKQSNCDHCRKPSGQCNEHSNDSGVADALLELQVFGWAKVEELQKQRNLVRFRCKLTRDLTRSRNDNRIHQ
jgi:hypothetical protein